MQKYTIRHIISTPEEVYIDISRRQTIREDFKEQHTTAIIKILYQIQLTHF